MPHKKNQLGHTDHRGTTATHIGKGTNMSKKNRKGGASHKPVQTETIGAADVATVTTEAVVTAAGTAAAKTLPGVCRVKAGAKLRGAREAWYQRLLKYEGKPLAEYVADCTANPPSTPTKGALAGKGEPPSGWVSWFKREGLLAVEAPTAEAEQPAA